jgi:hypothetical protein
VTTKLAHQTQKTAGIPNGMRTAVITAVSASAITISVSGGQFSAGVGVVTSYVPIVGDTVAVFRQDSSWLILGALSALNRWQPMSSLGYLSSYTDRGGTIAPIGQYRIVGDSVQLTGELSNAALTAPQPILPAGSLPAPSAEAILPGSINATNVRLVVSQAGAFTLFDPPTLVSGPSIVQFCCMYPLDPLLA